MGRMASCIGLCSERRSHSPLRQKTRCAIKEKAVYSKPPTPYHRPVSPRAKMAPIRYSPYAISTNPASLKAREKSHRSDLVFESLTHRKTVTKPNEPILCYLHDGLKRGFVREELLIVLAGTELPPLERWYSIGSPISSKSWNHTERRSFLKAPSLVVYFTVVSLSKASITLPYELFPKSLNTSASNACSEFWSPLPLLSVTLLTMNVKIFCGTLSVVRLTVVIFKPW